MSSGILKLLSLLARTPRLLRTSCRGMNGTTDLVSSMWRNGTLRRPALSVTYNLNASQAVLAMPPPTAAKPAICAAVPRTWWVANGGSDDTGSGHQVGLRAADWGGEGEGDSSFQPQN